MTNLACYFFWIVFAMFMRDGHTFLMWRFHRDLIIEMRFKF